MSWIELAWMILAPPARACGPDLTSMLVSMPPDELWVAPVADLRVELERLALPSRYRASHRSILDEELETIQAHGVSPEAWRRWRLGGPGERPALPDSLPRGFALYAEGGAAWRRGEIDAAVARFEAVLALPPEARGGRALPATLMLARASMREADYDRVLALVDAGEPDPLGLAAWALGEKAGRRLWSQDWRGAADLYLEQLGAGELGAVRSLQMVVEKARDAGALGSWVDDPVLARLATAWAVSRGGPYVDKADLAPARAWLDATRGAKNPIPDADWLGWMHYQAGDAAGAETWLARAAPSPLVHWLRGRLLLRAGQLAEAERELELAARGFPEGELWERASLGERGDSVQPAQEAWADTGLLRLSRRDWSGALDAFVCARRSQDAAYVVDRVLDLPEATTLTAALPAEPLGADLRWAVARRALRAGEPVDLEDFPSEFRDDVRRYQDGLARGQSDTSPRERARALWQAALVARQRGMEILGTELDPDYAMFEGNYELYVPPRARFESPQEPSPSAEEEARWRASAPTPDLRYHYRYTAAALAAEAAALLPDDDPDVPVILCRAWRWHRDRDPEEAARYTRLSVRRAGVFPSEPCGDPNFGADAGARRGLGVLALALTLGGVALTLGARPQTNPERPS